MANRYRRTPEWYYDQGIVEVWARFEARCAVRSMIGVAMKVMNAVVVELNEAMGQSLGAGRFQC